jgi:protein involved in polysaccharide export with SLBB domain
MIFLLINFSFASLLAESTDERNAVLGSINESPKSVNNAIQYSNKPFIAGDGILIDAFPDTTSFLNRSFPIDFDGMVDFPLLGKVKVTDMTIEQLETFIKTQFKSYLRYPNIRVKPVIRVSILGGVGRPGLYYVDYQNSLWEVIRMAGGTILESGLKEMHWERNRDEVTGDLIPFIQRGISLKDMGFRSGDQLWTPITPSQTFFQFTTANVLPLASFITSLLFFYITYQQTVTLYQMRGR